MEDAKKRSIKAAALRAWAGQVVRDGPGLPKGNVGASELAASTKPLAWPETAGEMEERWHGTQIRSHRFELLIEIPPDATDEYVIAVVEALRSNAEDTTLGERFLEARMDHEVAVKKAFSYEFGDDTWHVTAIMSIISVARVWEVSTVCRTLTDRHRRALADDGIVTQFAGSHPVAGGISGVDAVFRLLAETELEALERVHEALKRGGGGFEDLRARLVRGQLI